MFIKVNRISHNEEGVEILKETLINTDLITSVKEMVVEPTKLYNEDGEVVKVEEPTTKVFHVYQTTGPRIVLDEDNYKALTKSLLK